MPPSFEDLEMIRDQLTSDGKIESRLRRLADIDPDIDTTPAGAYRLEWLHRPVSAAMRSCPVAAM